MREPVEVAVLGTEALGAYTLVRVAGAGIDVGSPGQFAMALDPDAAGYLARPVGVFRLEDGEVAMLVDPAHRVGGLGGARRLRLLGPLGHGYDLTAAEPASTLLVAGGIGITVLPGVPLAIGGRPRMLAAFRLPTQAAATALVDADTRVVLAPASVLDALELAAITLVLGAGPTGLMHALAERCAAAGVACQVALEAPMGCGFGACYGCAVELDGATARLCLEGPVVDARRLAVAR